MLIDCISEEHYLHNYFKQQTINYDDNGVVRRNCIQDIKDTIDAYKQANNVKHAQYVLTYINDSTFKCISSMNVTEEDYLLANTNITDDMLSNDILKTCNHMIKCKCSHAYIVVIYNDTTFHAIASHEYCSDFTFNHYVIYRLISYYNITHNEELINKFYGALLTDRCKVFIDYVKKCLHDNYKGITKKFFTAYITAHSKEDNQYTDKYIDNITIREGFIVGNRDETMIHDLITNEQVIRYVEDVIRYIQKDISKYDPRRICRIGIKPKPNAHKDILKHYIRC